MTKVFFSSAIILQLWRPIEFSYVGLLFYAYVKIHQVRRLVFDNYQLVSSVFKHYHERSQGRTATSRWRLHLTDLGINCLRGHLTSYFWCWNRVPPLQFVKMFAYPLRPWLGYKCRAECTTFRTFKDTSVMNRIQTHPLLLVKPELWFRWIRPLGHDTLTRQGMSLSKWNVFGYSY